jgi:hypothetical protein
MRRVHGAVRVRDQDLDELAGKFLALIAEQPFRLGVDQDDPAVGGYAHHGVRSGLQERDKYGVGKRCQRCG